jgi:ribose 1,5-bisphosphokinase
MNGSRAMVATARETFPGTVVVLVEAAPGVRAQRLAGRGRETESEVAERLKREVPADIPNAIRVDNSGPVATGVSRFLAALRALPAN